MSMPQDAISYILGLGATHLWVCNESNGTTFADQASSGAKSMTIGSGVTPGGLGTHTGSVGFGGPRQPLALWDGTGNASCSAAGATLGGTAAGTTSGWSVFMSWVRPGTANFSPSYYPLYTERSASSTDVITFHQSSNNALRLTYSDAGHSETMTSGTNANNLGDGPVGFGVSTTGNVTFYSQGGVFGYVPSGTFMTTSGSAWTDSVTTNIGYDPHTGTSVNAGIAWVATFPFYVNEALWIQIYRQVFPDPVGSHSWSVARSGKVFPNSELWSSKLADNTPIDALSTGIIKQWGTFINSNGVIELLGRAEPMFDVDNAIAEGATSAGAVRDSFLISSDQATFLSRVHSSTAMATGDLEPQNSGNDATFGAVELGVGRQWDVFRGWTIDNALNVNRHPLWNPYINGVSSSVGGGTLAAGYYYYTMSAVDANGKESASYGGGLYAGNLSTHLTATGGNTLTFWVETPAANPAVQWKVYRRGPYVSPGGSSADWGLVATLNSVSAFPTLNTFTDAGLTSDTTKRPLVAGGTSATSLTLLAAASAGQNTIRIDPASNAFACFVTHATYGLAPGMLVIVGNGLGTAEQHLIDTVVNDTDVTLTTNLASAHAAGETVRTGNWNNGFGVSGQAFTKDWGAQGGGGSWDWYNNAAFNPTFSPGGATNNGCTASSRPVIAGQITLEEASAGVIPHPINLEIGTGNQASSLEGRRWPAPRHDGTAGGGTFFMKEGMRIRLPAGFNENSLTYTTVSPAAAKLQKALVVALRDYGFIDTDSTFAGGVITCESAPQTGRGEFSQFLGGLWQGLGTPAANNPNLMFFLTPGVTFTATLTANSTTITNVSSFTGVAVGNYIIGANVPYLTTVLSTNSGAGTLVMSNPPTQSGTAISMYMGVFYQLQVMQTFRYPAKTATLGTFTANTTSGSTTISNISSTANVYSGIVLSGTGIPHNATVLSVTGSSAVISQAATATGTGVTLTAARRTNRTDAGTINTPGFQQLVPY